MFSLAASCPFLPFSPCVFTHGEKVPEGRMRGSGERYSVGQVTINKLLSYLLFALTISSSSISTSSLAFFAVALGPPVAHLY